MATCNVTVVEGQSEPRRRCHVENTGQNRTFSVERRLDTATATDVQRVRRRENLGERRRDHWVELLRAKAARDFRIASKEV